MKFFRKSTFAAASAGKAPNYQFKTQHADQYSVDDFSNEITLAVRDDRSSGWLILALGGVTLLAAAILWAACFQIEEVTTGTASVVPSSHEQVLQSLEGGILQELLVHEADVVQKGQVVARIDPTRAEASFKESANRVRALRAQAARLRAESLGTELVFPPEVLVDRTIVTSEQENYNAKRRALDESIAGFNQARALVSQELGIAQELSVKGLLSATEVLKLKRQANEAQLQIIERRNRYRSDASAELSKVEGELSTLGETVAGRLDTLERTEVRSPVNGIINNIRINTIGGVIQPGAEIMEVTPLDDTLLVETKVKPADVAFLHPGQDAMIKLSAYDFSTYGGLKGSVEHISPGALKDDEARNRPGAETTYYRVMVRTHGNSLTKGGSQELRIIPGMTATVDILTGRKTMLDYLLQPILRVQEAFHEK
ncbi:HlyD family type I secretion periplasmic adaptor subunit [Pseudomonas sp. OV226]|uniref:HlyD family type I secretion periplasmic adaptor subunit n=1 Tax=Pseudomonas sp. OV226 TaxID=2135588 RepID=UPI000D6B2704|nr:HlyD family type I secretion periplasmic adaptor subunit [Pseudomonas sp. OV226]PWK29712.1 adhesin transport system membrane fusion protein [Pseudomonas sp. OV226]